MAELRHLRIRLRPPAKRDRQPRRRAVRRARRQPALGRHAALDAPGQGYHGALGRGGRSLRPRLRLAVAPRNWLAGWLAGRCPPCRRGLPRRAYMPGTDPGICDSLVSQQGLNYALAKRLQRWRASLAWRPGAPCRPASPRQPEPGRRSEPGAYAGAHRFGAEMFEPATTRALLAALLVHDAGRTVPALTPSKLQSCPASNRPLLAPCPPPRRGVRAAQNDRSDTAQPAILAPWLPTISAAMRAGRWLSSVSRDRIGWPDPARCVG
jgi:hypothetical protein